MTISRIVLARSEATWSDAARGFVNKMRPHAVLSPVKIEEISRTSSLGSG